MMQAMLDRRRLRHAPLPIALLLIVAFAVMISAGRFDPQPHGELRLRVPRQTLDAGSYWMADGLHDFSLRATLTFANDRPVAVIVGSESRYTALAVAPAGYFAIWQQSAERQIEQPWQPWPYLHEQQVEIWLDRQGENAQIRLNRERLPYTLPLDCDRCEVGVLSTDAIIVELFELYAP